MRRRFRSLRRSEGGVSAVEFALFAPFLGLLLLGGVDVGRYVIARASVDKVAFSVANVATQYTELNSSAMKTIFSVTGSSLGDYVSGANGVTIVTSLIQDSGAPKVRWQCQSSASRWASKIGAEGKRGAVNPELLADANDNLLVAEVFYIYKPLFFRFFKSDVEFYTAAIYRPRLGALTTKPCP